MLNRPHYIKTIFYVSPLHRVATGINFIILSLGLGNDLAKSDIHIFDE